MAFIVINWYLDFAVFLCSFAFVSQLVLGHKEIYGIFKTLEHGVKLEMPEPDFKRFTKAIYSSGIQFSNYK